MRREINFLIDNIDPDYGITNNVFGKRSQNVYKTKTPKIKSVQNNKLFVKLLFRNKTSTITNAAFAKIFPNATPSPPPR